MTDKLSELEIGGVVTFGSKESTEVEKILPIPLPVETPVDDPNLMLLFENPSHDELQRIIALIYKNGIKSNHEQMMKFYKLSATNENAKAQYELAIINQDTDLMKRSAEHGYAPAQYNLGINIDDPKERIKWLTLAAENNHLDAMYLLGTYRMNYTEDSCNKEICYMAFRWANTYVEKADQQNIYAMVHVELYHLYHEGLGTKQDDKKAFEHLDTAIRLVMLHRCRYAMDLFTMRPSRSELGNLYAMMGDMYFNGWGTQQDDAEALRYYLLGASNKDKNAIYQLYVMYNEGLGVHINTQKAEEYLVESADLIHMKAKYNLGRTILLKYFTIWDLPLKEPIKNDFDNNLIENAIIHLKTAGYSGDVDACVFLGITYWKLKNYDKCNYWWTFARTYSYDNERADVNYYLGIIHRDGIHVDKDYSQAIYHFRMFLIKHKPSDEIRVQPQSDYTDLLKKFKLDLSDIKQNVFLAFLSCESLVTYDNVVAMFILSWLYWTGQGTEQNEKMAVKYYCNALLNDKTNELGEIRQKLQSYENEIVVHQLRQIDENKDDSVNILKIELDASKKQINELTDQMKNLLASVGKIKDKQDSMT